MDAGAVGSSIAARGPPWGGQAAGQLEGVEQ
jgi:hypothetical protein